MWGVFFFCALFSLYLSISVKNTFFAAILIVLGSLLIAFVNLERKKPRPEKAVLIALLSSVSTVGRVLFVGIPSVQPSSFVIILSGISFGPEIGLLTGILTAFCSNLVLGQGPWTIWQMFLWGLMGFFSGLMGGMLKKSKVLLAVYGLLWGLLFGWGMNLWFVFGYSQEFHSGAFRLALVTSFPMDLAHGLFSVALLLLAAPAMIGRLNRIGVKYGLK